MKTKLLLAASLVVLTAIAHAGDSPTNSGVSVSTSTSSSANAQTEWNTNPGYWERVLIQKRDSQDLQMGKSGWVLKGPIVEGLRRQRSTGDRSAGQRLLGLPIVRLLVPQPMPSPPGGGKYFRWSDSDRPWVAIVEGAAPGSSSNNPVTHEARTTLVSIGR